jgi:hypothetical protein
MGQARGKKQKTVLLHDDLCDLLDAHEGFIGANFTRIITAAVLQYIFMDPLHGPETRWVSVAVALDRGNLAVADIPNAIYEELLRFARFNVRLAEQSDVPDDDRIATAKKSLAEVEAEFAEWKKAVEWAGDPMVALREALTITSRWLKKGTPVYGRGPDGKETVGKHGEDQQDADSDAGDDAVK